MHDSQRRRGRALRAALLAVTGLSPTAAHAANTVFFSISDVGQTKSVAEWGVDAAWPNYDNVRQSVEHMGAANVDVVRVTFHPVKPSSPTPTALTR